MRLLEVGTRTGRAAESLLAQLNAGQIEYVGLEQSRDAAERPAEARPGTAPVCPSGMQTRWRRTLTRRTLSGLITPCIVCCRKIGLLATLQQLAVPGALLYVMEFRQLTPSALLSTLLLTNGQPEACCITAPTGRHYLARPASTVSMAMRSRGYNASSYNVLTGRCAAIPVNFRPPSPGVCRGGWCRNGSSSSTPYR